MFTIIHTKVKLICCFAIVFFYTALYSQTSGQWTWIKGSNSFNSAGTFGTMGVPASGNQPPALYQACTWRDQQDNLWLFGGISGGSLYAAMWKFDISTGNWTWMKGPSASGTFGVYGTKGVPSASNNPGARSFGVMTWKDLNGNFWLFGGYGYDAAGASNYMNDLWRFNPNTLEWTWMAGSSIAAAPGTFGTIGIPSAANTPPSLSENHLCWTDLSGNLWLYGGISATGNDMDDLWKFDLSVNQWVWVSGSSNGSIIPSYGPLGVFGPTYHPGARFGYTSFTHPSGDLYLFGAEDLNGNSRNDVWKYNIAANQWAFAGGTNTGNSLGSYINKCDTITVNFPAAYTEMRATWADSCGFWVFGGYNFNAGSSYNGLWYYNADNYKFTWVSGTTVANDAGNYGIQGTSAATNDPPARNGAVTWSDNKGNLWLFGGEQDFGAALCYNDMWRYTPDPNCVALCSQSIFNTGLSANFTGGGNGCPPLIVSFNSTFSNGNTYFWDFGDGTTSTQQDPVHTYNQPGTFTVSLIVTDASGADTVIHANAVTVGSVPTASFTTSQDTICLGQPVSFINTSSAIGGIGGSSWSFGDGNSSSQNNPTYNYSVSGLFNVSLTVSDSSGACKDTIIAPLLVLPNANMVMGLSPNSGCEDLLVTFTSSSSSNNINTFWNFGDGSNSSQANPLHTYTSAGTYIVSLSGSNSIGCSDTAVSTVNVLASATAALTANPLSGCLPVTVNLINLSSGYSSVFWYWPANNSNSNSNIFPVVCTQGGTYSVTLIAYSANNCNDTLNETIVVNELCENIFVPNVFTPNGDNNNELFFVQVTGYTNYHIIIYNRWGLKMYEDSDPQSAWNGTIMNNGDKCPDGTYYYLITVNSETGETKEIKGYFGLYR